MRRIFIKWTWIVCLVLSVGVVGCGDDEDSEGGASNGATSNSTTGTSNGTTSNGTTGTSNGTTGTSNGTTGTSNGTTGTSNGTTGTSNGTTATSNGTTATSNGTTGTSNGTTGPINPVEIGDCSEFAACGGDPIGVWSTDEFCTVIEGAPDDPIEDCEGESLTFEPSAGGTLNIKDDGTYTLLLSVLNTATFIMPQICLPQDVGCGFFEDALAEEDPDAGWFCTGTEDACECTGFPGDMIDFAGTWVDNGDATLTLTDSDGEATIFEFCADANSMKAVSLDEDDPVQLEMSRIIGGD